MIVFEDAVIQKNIIPTISYWAIPDNDVWVKEVVTTNSQVIKAHHLCLLDESGAVFSTSHVLSYCLVYKYSYKLEFTEDFTVER